MNFEKLKKELIMSKEELREIVDTHMQSIDVEVVTDMINNIMEPKTEEDRKKMAEASMMLKMVYMATEVYKLGFMYALYNYNDAIKKQLADIAPVQPAVIDFDQLYEDTLDYAPEASERLREALNSMNKAFEVYLDEVQKGAFRQGYTVAAEHKR